MAAAHATKKASARKWLAVATMTNVTSRGYRRQKMRPGRLRTSLASGQPIRNAKHTCIEGTAAYGLNSASTVLLSCVTPAKFETASKKPHSGRKRGGAVGKTM